MSRELQILIVEDNFDDMEYCSKIIEAMPMEKILFRVGNSKSALQILSKQAIDIAFIDVILPDMNGFKLARRIREIKEYQFLNIIFITGKQADQLNVFKRLHCYDFITKPFSKKEFLQRVYPLLQGICNQKQLPPAQKEKLIFIQTDAMLLIKFDDVYYAEAQGRTIQLITRNGTFQQVKMSLKDFISYVNHPDFQRSHRSFAVNINNIVKIQSCAPRVWNIYFNDEISCMLSKTYFNAITPCFERTGK